jgi:hypothetical protein
MSLTKDQILSASDFKIQSVDVPEWGGSVFIRSLTSRNRDRLEEKMKGHSLVDARALVVACCACDENGVLLFEEKDVESITQKSGTATGRIFDAAMKMLRFSEEDLQEAVKN